MTYRAEVRDRYAVDVADDLDPAFVQPVPGGGVRVLPNGQSGYPGVIPLDPPGHLLIFEESNWPGADRRERIRSWEQAAGAWWARHNWPGGIEGLAALVAAERRQGTP